MDGSRNIATLHACLDGGADAFGIVRAVKQRLAERHKIAHATVEIEHDHCADIPAHAH
jgi:cobalt-zinc-cadmium efflux system protein